MSTIYIERLEQIITDMQGASREAEHNMTKVDELPWLEFLERVHPESRLLKREEVPANESPPIIEEIQDTNVKQYHDIRELMLLAERNQYPTWFIQPHFKEGTVLLIYEQGTLTNPQADIPGIPERIEGFSGTVSGIWSRDNPEQSYTALDVDQKMNFQERMQWLRDIGLTVQDFILFPTDRIQTISSHKLETLFQQYLSTVRERGINVEGVFIISDTPLHSGEEEDPCHHIIFQPSSDT